MPAGPGKYDDLCTMVRQQVGIDEHRAGGVVILVFGGNRGSGFSFQGDLTSMMLLPEALRDVATEIERGT